MDDIGSKTNELYRKEEGQPRKTRYWEGGDSSAYVTDENKASDKVGTKTFYQKGTDYVYRANGD